MRETVNSKEESILDHFSVCKGFFRKVKEFLLDEAETYSLTKYSNKSGSKATVKPSDHRTLFLTLNHNWISLTKSLDDRIEVYDFKNSDNLAKFVRNTDTNEALRTCFDEDMEDLETWKKIKSIGKNKYQYVI